MRAGKSIWGLGLVAAITLVLLGTQSHLRAANEEHRLTGSWNTVVTATNPQGLPPLKVLLTFTGDGQVIDARRLYNPFSPFGPLLFTPAHGVWERTAQNQFAVTIVDFFQAAPNNPAADGSILGEEKVRYRVTLDHSGENLSGQLVGEVKDTQGNVVFSFTATVQGTRIHAEPLN